MFKFRQRKIYVASSWRNAIQPDTVRVLREFGHQVYDFRNPPNGSNGFGWSKIDPNWQQWSNAQYLEAINTQQAKEGFQSDWEGMTWADTCVLVLPCGRSAHLEAGYFVGAGKELFIFTPVGQEPELMYKMATRIVTRYEELADCVGLNTAQPRGTS